MATNQRKISRHEVQKELLNIERLFRSLEKDKSLPTFGEHFMQCLIFGIAEHVDLKKMYPKTYLKLKKWLAEHERVIVAGRHK